MRFCKMLNDKDKKVMMLIEQDATHSNYFFHRVKDLRWFYPLKEKGFFLPQQIPQSESGDFLFWNILDYLERVSGQVAQNTQYGKELIEIIDSLVCFSIKRKERKGQGINNYHIWWYCVKLLNNLPSAIIKDNLTIEKFHIWLSVWTDHSLGSDLTISDIGEKLLPKFLHDDFAPDYIYAETIINVITAIKAGGKSNAFTKQEDAALAWHSYWIRDTFKKHSQLIGKKCSLNVVFGLADRLKNTLEYKQKDHYVDIDIGKDVYRIEVTRIFAGGLKPGEIKFKDDQYECLVRQFSGDQLKGVDWENDFWALHNLEPQDERGRFTFSASTKGMFVTEIKKNLPKGINWQNADKLEKKLFNIHEGLFSDYSHVWCRTLKSGPEHGDGAEEVLTVILRDVLLAKCEVNRKEGKQVLNAFLSDRYQFPIFRRFVLLCADKFWADYSEFLVKLIKVIPSILEESDLEVEMQDILQHHNNTFGQTLKVRLKELINAVPEYYVKEGEKLSAYWKYKWLSPLRDDSEFKALYEEARQRAEPKDGKPYESARSAFKGGFVTHKSPIPKEAVLQKPIAELVKYLDEFKGADFWHGAFEGEPDKEGLADALQAAVQEQPQKFMDELELFNHEGLYRYVHHILWGFRDAWKSGIPLAWDKLFDFCLKYIKQPSFMDDAIRDQGEDSGKYRGKYLWVADAIVDLIEDGSRDDKRAFEKKYFDKAEEIFDCLLHLVKGEPQPDTQRDAITYAINTTLGKVIEAYVIFSLRVARVNGSTEEWGKNKYERFLSKGIEAYIFLGRYLPNLRFLDQDWVEKKIRELEGRPADDFEWQMFMEGYLTGSRIYQDLYGLMRPNYVTALQSTVFKGRADQRLVEHICIGYLQIGELLQQKNDDGQDSLFWKMLNEVTTSDNRDRWSEVAGFFWSISGKRLKKEEKADQEEPSEDFKKKVLAFWEWTFKEQEFVKSKLGDEYGSFLSRMAELTIWLEKIDETAEKWLMLSAPFIEIEHRSAFFTEYLTQFDDEDSVKRIGKIFLKVLESTTPTFRKENIELIVRRIHKKGDRDDAIAICNTYGRRGIHFLKPAWEDFQKKNDGVE